MENETDSLVCPSALTRYFIEGKAGRLQLPGYETNPRGEVIIVPGEIFCRAPGCSKSTNAMIGPSAIRKHLAEWHDLVCEPSMIGRPTKEEKNTRLKWFAELPSVDEEEQAEEGAKD